MTDRTAADPIVVEWDDSFDLEKYRLIARLGADKAGVTVTVSTGESSIELPEDLTQLLVHAAAIRVSGEQAALVASSAYISTQDAARVLGVSRPTVVRMCTSGALPFVRVNRHRRLRLRDVLEYQARQKDVVEKALADMVAQTQTHGDYSLDQQEVQELVTTLRRKA